MPPASLSTFEVIRPGPTTASSTARRRRVMRVRRMKFVPRAFHVASVVGLVVCSAMLVENNSEDEERPFASRMTTKPKNQPRPPEGGRYQSQILNSSAKLNAKSRRNGAATGFERTYFRVALKFCTHTAYYVVYGDGADRTIIAIDDGQAPQIVFIEQLENFLVVRTGCYREQRFECEFGHALVRIR